jgi:ribose 5-phosphate isomerase B
MSYKKGRRTYILKIAIGSDHAGYHYKEKIKKFLSKMEYKVLDLGTFNEKPCDYPDFAKKVAICVSKKKASAGVLICGTGNGMAMAANKIKGVRAAVCNDTYTTRYSRKHNNANIFCVGARIKRLREVKRLLKIWLNTPFNSERHTARVRKLNNL